MIIEPINASSFLVSLTTTVQETSSIRHEVARAKSRKLRGGNK